VIPVAGLALLPSLRVILVRCAPGVMESVLIAHWNGSTWATFGAPALHRSAVPADVAASSAKNVWAVGAISSPHGTRTLILHFNGVRGKRGAQRRALAGSSATFHGVLPR